MAEEPSEFLAGKMETLGQAEILLLAASRCVSVAVEVQFEASHSGELVTKDQNHICLEEVDQSVVDVAGFVSCEQRTQLGHFLLASSK